MADATGPIDTFVALASEAGIGVEDLEQECREHDLYNFVDLCDPWEVIGHHLRLKKADISAIKEDYNSAELRRLEMLKKWRNTTLRPTYRMLIEAFLRSNKTQQALSICNKIKRLYSEDSNTRQVRSREQYHNVSSVPMSYTADHTVHTSLMESIRDLELKFSDVQRQFVRADGVTLEELKECVATLPSFKSTSPAQLLRSVSVHEFFHYLKDYCNTQSHDILDDLIQMLGDNETKKKMSDFKMKYKAFQRRVKLKDFVGKYEGHMTTPSNYKELEMKLGENWREKTLEDLEILRRQISLEAWLFKKIEEGCFIVKYLVPSHENLLLDDMNAYLHSQNVLYILIDKKPVFTSKQDVGDSTADTSSQLALDLSPPPTKVMDIVPSSQLTSAAGLAGVEVCAETTLVVTNNPQSFIWKGYGLKIHIPQGCLPEGVDKCTIKIQASLSGLYEFPDNSFLVSAVFWLRCEPQCKFSVPISMEIQHCARAENMSKLSFVKAYCSQRSLPYTFRAVAGGLFSSSCSFGILELDSFSGVAVTQEGTEEREYMARLFYLNQTISSHDIHLVVTWNSEAHITVVEDVYCQKKQARPGPEQPVDFESEQIKLDIPQKGVRSEDGWVITPLTVPVVTKSNVDKYKPHKMIPHCELSADFKSASSETTVPPLCYQVKLLGAKEPYNMFTIKPPLSGMGNVTYHSSVGQSSSTKRTQQSTSGPNCKKRRTMEGSSEASYNDKTGRLQSKLTLKQLLKELHTKAADWKDMGIQLDINVGELKQLKSDNPGNSKACLREMLEIWLNRVDPPPSWSAIAEAIEYLGDEQLAQELRSKYSCEEQ